MKRTLYWKFLLAYLIFAFFGFFVVANFVSGMTLDHLKKEKAESLYQEAVMIAGTYASELYDNRISLETAKNQLDALDIYLSSTIWIMNPSGRIVVDSKKPIDVDNQVVVEAFDPTVTGSTYYTVGTFFGMFDENMLSVFAPITSDFKVKGYVVILTPMSAIEQESNSLLNISYLLLVILFLLSLIILIFFTEMVYLPLRKITRATEQYAGGNLSYQLSVDSEDEIGYLAASLSYMAEALAQGGENQKKLVANISHDFRSPLTSISGYVQAMLDGTIPPELHEKYLQIVLNETERLTKLTNNLLTLNNLNTEGMVLEKSTFDINRVIKNTVATFEGICRERQIVIDLVLTGDSMLVTADLSKIQQVLYNLLDNAIKFSHHDSHIKIETTQKHNKVFISVKDNGIGIPKDSLKFIWDRFYKTDLSRGKDKKGTGLGLSITKEIIRAHSENINVISTEGAGSEFIFSLPCVDMDED